MTEPGIFISDAEFNYLMTLRKKGKFNPDREFIRQEVEKYLKAGGKITKIDVKTRTLDEILRANSEVFYNE